MRSLATCLFSACLLAFACLVQATFAFAQDGESNPAVTAAGQPDVSGAGDVMIADQPDISSAGDVVIPGDSNVLVLDDGDDMPGHAGDVIDDDVLDEDMIDEPAPAPKPRARSAKDNFTGARLGADVILGVARCDDKVFCAGHGDKDYNEKHTGLAAGIQLEIGWLWGNGAFQIGPALDIAAGYPNYLDIDLRLKMAIAVSRADAIILGAGFGFSLLGQKLELEAEYIEVSDENAQRYKGIDEEYADNVRSMYIPIQLGYEHVFRNGFVLGGSAQYCIGFNYKVSYYASPMMDSYYRSNRITALHFLGGTVHVGYKL